MGITKYDELNINYPLKDVLAADVKKVKELEQLLK